MTATFFWTAFLTLLPIAELRGGIPYAIANGMNPFIAYFYCVVLNACIGPLLYFFLSTLHKVFYKWEWYKALFDRLVIRARLKLHDKVERYGYLGIALFVAVPLPVTGAYTGTLGAWVIGLDRKKTYLAVLLGVAIAGIVVSAIWLSGTHVFSFFIKEVHL